MFDERMEMDLSTLGPLAERAVDALESIAESLSKMGHTADLQADILSKLSKHHNMLDRSMDMSQGNVRPLRTPSLRSALRNEDDGRG